MVAKTNDRTGEQLFRDGALATALLLALCVVILMDRSDTTPASSAVDLVFVLDDTAAMTGAVDSMKLNCLEQAKTLRSSVDHCRFAVVPFGSGETPRVGGVALTADFDAFQQQFKAAPGDRSADSVAASATAAMQQALGMDFRDDASVFFFLITNTPVAADVELAGVSKDLEQRGIGAIVQADAAEQAKYRPLYRNQGRFFSLKGEDLTEPAPPGEQTKAEARVVSLFTPVTSAAAGEAEAPSLVARGLYGLRSKGSREKWITTVGGTRESEKAVSDGLVWLARHQADDGYWSDQAKCEQPRCSQFRFGATHAETGLAILAFQAGGHYYFNNRKYSDNVRRGLDWLVAQQRQDGCLFGPKASWYEHGIATFAIAEACAVALAEGQEFDPQNLDSARRAIAFMEQHQYAGGGWRYDLRSRAGGDTSVTGWQVLALKSALEAKIKVDPATVDKVAKFFEACGNPSTGQTNYMITHPRSTELTTAVGLIVQEFILHTPDSPLAQNAVKLLQDRASAGIGGSGDYYTLYNATLAMFLAGGEPWDHWNDHVRDKILQRQQKTGCGRGSWPDGKYSRTLSTAWAVLTLEVYYRYAPTKTDPGAE